MKTYEEQLDSVQQAIEDAEKSQELELEVNGNRRKHRKANLAELYKREQYLLRMIQRKSYGDCEIGVPHEL